MPFKVTNLGTNQKLIDDFLLVINTMLPPILHRFQDVAFDKSKIAIYGYPSCVKSRRWSGFLHHIIVSDTSLKIETLGYICVVESLGISSATFTQCAQKLSNC